MAPDLRDTRRYLGWFVLALLAACSAPASEGERTLPGESELTYRADYCLTVDPASQSVKVALTVAQPQSLLREVRFDTLDGRVTSVEGDGDVQIENGEVVWSVPDSGGELSWRASVPHRRGNSGYDAWLDVAWGIFRAEDVVPRAATRTLKGAQSQTTLNFELPAGWSAVTEYSESDGLFRVERPGRRFAEPAGWIAVGELGVRREKIDGIQIAVAAPTGEDVRRMDMLAMANWVLPEIVRLLPAAPSRITIISAGEPMWRGGLSAPQSIYLHADRPLISENGTSTLIHEWMHVSLGLSARRGYDWIVEGLAEYYSIELLRRSGTITERRFERAMAFMDEWAEDAKTLCAPSSSGPTTALAVRTMLALNQEILSKSGGEKSLDGVVYALVATGAQLDLDNLRRTAAEIIGEDSDVLHSGRLPGCRKLDATP